MSNSGGKEIISCTLQGTLGSFNRGQGKPRLAHLQSLTRNILAILLPLKVHIFAQENLSYIQYGLQPRYNLGEQLNDR